MQCQCDYNVSIRVLQQYVKTQHPGNFSTSDLYYNRFSQLGKPSVYHTPRRPQLQFYDVIFSLVIRLLVHWHNDLQHCVKIAEREAQRRSNVLRVKKLFVLAALLIEQYHQHMRSSQQDKTKKRRPEVTL